MILKSASDRTVPLGRLQITASGTEVDVITPELQTLVDAGLVIVEGTEAVAPVVEAPKVVEPPKPTAPK